MNAPIENYNSLKIRERLRKQAFGIWAVAASIAAIWFLAIILAPALEASGMEAIASPVSSFFSYLCHQIPERSFHFHDGKFAVCSRCFGFYGGVLAGFLAYPIFRKIEETEPFTKFWLFLAMIPMAIDWSLGFLGIWENTHISRFTTGLILGGACAVYVVPALVEIGELIALKRLRRAA